MTQSRTMSFIESVTQVVIGYFVSLLAQLVVFPLFGLRVSLTDNLMIGACFLVASLARSYALRRIFDGPLCRKAHQRDPYAEPWA
jgi:hypothetical protein